MGRIFITNAMNFNETPIIRQGGGLSFITLNPVFEYYTWTINYITLTLV
jgi:hypothetical protein